LTDNTVGELLEKMNHSVSMIYCSINFHNVCHSDIYWKLLATEKTVYRC